MSFIKLKYKKIHPEAKITRPEKGNAGYDLHAVSYSWNKDACAWMIKTGICLEIPEGYVGIIKDRSGQAKLSVETHAGVIDSSYRGELIVLLSARKLVYDLVESLMPYSDIIEQDYAFKKYLGKFAQIVIVPYLDLPLEETTLSETERGDKGFGSSGT